MPTLPKVDLNYLLKCCKCGTALDPEVTPRASRLCRACAEQLSQSVSKTESDSRHSG